jgi:hypothetical protein
MAMRMVRLVLLLIGFVRVAHAQPQATVYEGEIGISTGIAHYFGDLNNRASLNRPKMALGAFYRKQVSDYIGVRLGLHYARLGYSDVYSKNEFQIRRNLSFNTSIWEVALQGDFNFFRFVPGDPDHMFTPYVTLGVGVFTYDPYAFLDGEKYFLRPLGTEGQGSPLYPERQPYGNTAFCFPIGMGIKYNISPTLNFAFEVSHRFTGTDYLDDVSSTYAGPAAFNPGTPAAQLQDRSNEIGPAIGFAGRQRGFSAQKDQFIFIEASIAIALSSYRCPTPGRPRN